MTPNLFTIRKDSLDNQSVDSIPLVPTRKQSRRSLMDTERKDSQRSLHSVPETPSINRRRRFDKNDSQRSLRSAPGSPSKHSLHDSQRSLHSTKQSLHHSQRLFNSSWSSRSSNQNIVDDLWELNILVKERDSGIAKLNKLIQDKEEELEAERKTLSFSSHRRSRSTSRSRRRSRSRSRDVTGENPVDKLVDCISSTCGEQNNEECKITLKNEKKVKAKVSNMDGMFHDGRRSFLDMMSSCNNESDSIETMKASNHSTASYSSISSVESFSNSFCNDHDMCNRSRAGEKSNTSVRMNVNPESREF